MYGTVARMVVKESELPGIEEKFRQIGVGTARGQLGVYVYQMDRDSREFFFAVMFESEEAYRSNATSPEQGQRFAQLAAMLEGEPEWNDGHIIFSLTS